MRLQAWVVWDDGEIIGPVQTELVSFVSYGYEVEDKIPPDAYEKTRERIRDGVRYGEEADRFITDVQDALEFPETAYFISAPELDYSVRWLTEGSHVFLNETEARRVAETRQSKPPS